MRHGYYAACGAAVGLLCAILVLTALREHSLSGQVLILLFLLATASALVTASRYIVCASALLTALVLSIDSIDAVKMEMTNHHLQVSDVLILAGMIRHSDLGFARQYWDLIEPWVIGAGVGAIVLIAAIFLERRFALTGRRLRLLRVVFAASLVACFVQATVLARSGYMASIGALHPYHKITERNDLRASVVFDSVARFGRLQVQLEREAIEAGTGAAAMGTALAATPPAGSCETCPDLVVVHLESTFDPATLRGFDDEPGYLTRMQSDSALPARSGHLFVNIFGGGSWISEFEVLCGAHHGIFEEGGIYPHAYIAHHLRSCLPAHLQRLGYETHAIYTTSPFFAGVGAGFRSYGIEHFADPPSLGAPAAWKDQRDEHFVDALGKLLDRPSARPRFVFLSTNSNHGPHGGAFVRQPFPGPFRVEQTSDPALQDYINRLNDTYTTMLRLERELMASGRPVAVLFYGDHQPSFRKRFARKSARLGRPPRYLTLYRMARTYGGLEPGPAPVMRIEDLASEFLAFAAVPPSPSATLIRAIVAKNCPTSPIECRPEMRRAMRALLMRGT